MPKISEIIKKSKFSIYQQLAEKYNLSYNYVGEIARGNQNPKTGRGHKVLLELKAIAEKESVSQS